VRDESAGTATTGRATAATCRASPASAKSIRYIPLG
jgi:hypothetical protein